MPVIQLLLLLYFAYRVQEAQQVRRAVSLMHGMRLLPVQVLVQ